MGDETWCFAHEPETKRQISGFFSKTTPRPKQLKFQSSRIKPRLIYFFDSQDVVHKEFRPKRKTVNAEIYKEVMNHFLKRI
jgi:hypothetical protein